jgi:2-polyprenyl-3-methyl-5-hydroxy-6-metoxy-1,4-benzoquinol methylase
MTSVITEKEFQAAADYLEDKVDSEYFRSHKTRYLHTLRSIDFKRGMSVLDVGAFPGHMASILTQCGCNVWMINHTSHYPKSTDTELKEIVPLGHVVYADVDKDCLPFEDSMFDVIILTEVIEHFVQSPEHAIKEIGRTLRPGGFLICTTPNVLGLSKITSLLLRRRANPEGGLVQFYSTPLHWRHHFEYTLKELTYLFTTNGFVIVRAGYFDYHFPVPHPVHIINLLLQASFLRVFKSFREGLIVIATK